MQATCSECGKTFEAQRVSAKLCGPACRKRASRRNQVAGGQPRPVAPPRPAGPPRIKVVEPPPDEPDAGDSGHSDASTLRLSLLEATRRQLEDLGQVDSVLGQQALRLAERMMSPFDTGSALAALSKEFGRVMDTLVAQAPAQSDALDELSQRRHLKAAGG